MRSISGGGDCIKIPPTREFAEPRIRVSGLPTAPLSSTACNPSRGEAEMLRAHVV